jgi:hypothetical protein
MCSVDIVLGTLLARCAHDKRKLKKSDSNIYYPKDPTIVAALEMIPVAIDSQELVMGVIRVKLTEEHDLDDVAFYLETLHNNQLQQLRQFDDLSDLENGMSNMALSVEFTGEGHRSRPDRIAKLGIIQYARFERLGEATPPFPGFDRLGVRFGGKHQLKIGSNCPF